MIFGSRHSISYTLHNIQRFIDCIQSLILISIWYICTTLSSSLVVTKWDRVHNLRLWFVPLFLLLWPSSTPGSSETWHYCQKWAEESKHSFRRKLILQTQPWNKWIYLSSSRKLCKIFWFKLKAQKVSKTSWKNFLIWLVLVLRRRYPCASSAKPSRKIRDSRLFSK